MNIEELSKSQLILLTILVNFITSIATGILTVSLLDQAPPSLTQTINHIVERTVQTIVPSSEPAAAATAAQAIPSEQDLITSAIAADAARAVTLYDAMSTSTPRATGTYLPQARAVIVPASAGLPQQASVVFADGTATKATLTSEANGAALYRFGAAAQLPAAPSVNLVPAHSLVLGETALAVTANGSAATGIVSHKNGGVVSTTLPALDPGSAVVDTSGDLIGLINGAADGGLISADAIGKVLAATSTALQ